MLLHRKDLLGAEINEYTKLEARLLSGSMAGIEKRMIETRAFKEQTSMWTDNIYILEQHLMKLASGDRQTVDLVKREFYGEEYSDGGLKELDFEDSGTQNDQGSEN